MTGYIARRLVLMIPVLWGVSLIVFFAIRMVPGDVIMAKMQGEFSTKPEQMARMRAELGLDVPGYVQYGRWIGGLVRGDLGTSLAAHEPVSKLIGDRLVNSAFLVFCAGIISIPLSVAIGAYAALRRDRTFDVASSLSPEVGVTGR